MLTVMRHYSSFLFGLALLIIPSLCHAESITVWDLQNQKKIEGWNTVNLTSVQLTPGGLSVSTTTNGQLVKVSSIRHAVDTVAISYTSPAGGNGIFIWRAPGMAEDQVYQIPVQFAPGNADQKLVLDMSQVPEWDPRSDRIGFVINAGTNVIFQKVELSGPSSLSTLVYPFKTFFRLDRARAYSINFLWGPLMTYSEHQYSALFTAFPPSADSWNIVFYWILGIGFVFTVWFARKGSTRAVVLFTLLFTALWLIYDARMGAEIISYAKKDIQTWWSKPYELKDYRDRGSFAAFANLAAEYTEGKNQYAFLASHGWPFWSTILYTTYPAIPLTLDSVTDDTDVWLIYNRRDITVDDEGRLTLDGEAISPPGDVILPFEPGSFVFLVR